MAQGLRAASNGELTLTALEVDLSGDEPVLLMDDETLDNLVLDKTCRQLKASNRKVVVIELSEVAIDSSTITCGRGVEVIGEEIEQSYSRLAVLASAKGDTDTIEFRDDDGRLYQFNYIAAEEATLEVSQEFNGTVLTLMKESDSYTGDTTLTLRGEDVELLVHGELVADVELEDDACELLREEPDSLFVITHETHLFEGNPEDLENAHLIGRAGEDGAGYFLLSIDNQDAEATVKDVDGTSYKIDSLGGETPHVTIPVEDAEHWEIMSDNSISTSGDHSLALRDGKLVVLDEDGDVVDDMEIDPNSSYHVDQEDTRLYTLYHNGSYFDPEQLDAENDIEVIGRNTGVVDLIILAVTGNEDKITLVLQDESGLVLGGFYEGTPKVETPVDVEAYLVDHEGGLDSREANILVAGDDISFYYEGDRVDVEWREGAAEKISAPDAKILDIYGDSLGFEDDPEADETSDVEILGTSRDGDRILVVNGDAGQLTIRGAGNATYIFTGLGSSNPKGEVERPDEDEDDDDDDES